MLQKTLVNSLHLYMKNIWKESWRNTCIKDLETQGQNHKEMQ